MNECVCVCTCVCVCACVFAYVCVCVCVVGGWLGAVGSVQGCILCVAICLLVRLVDLHVCI